MSQEEKTLNPAFMAEFTEFFEEINGESDRAVAILGAAKIDTLLYHLLSLHLLPNTGSEDDFLDQEKPLGTFSAKIKACYRLGLIDADFARALHLSRKIRNDFAHEFGGAKIDTGPQANRVREILRVYARYSGFDELKKVFFQEANHSFSIDYRFILSLMVARLQAVCDEVIRISGNQSWSLIPPTWKKDKEGQATQLPVPATQP